MMTWHREYPARERAESEVCLAYIANDEASCHQTVNATENRTGGEA